MIEAENLTRRFGTRTAVDHVSFTAQQGKIYGFLGPNGARKSTVMNMLTGYLAVSEGKVLIDGQDLQKEPQKAKRNIGYLPETAPVYPDMTVREYLRFAAELKKVPKRRREEEIRRVLDAAELRDVSERLCRNLSKGYRQRAGLAQALLGNPEILILDEPTSGLDPQQQKELFSLLNRLRKEHTIIISSHILSDIRAVADVVWIMKEGKLVASDTPENLQSRMSASQSILLRVSGKREDLETALLQIPEVKTVSVREEKDTLVFSISSDSGKDLRPAISKAAVYVGGAVLEIRREEKSLEEVFLTMTGETPQKEPAYKEPEKMPREQSSDEVSAEKMQSSDKKTEKLTDAEREEEESGQEGKSE